MLKESRLLSFMTKDECYAVHILEGQKIIKDLAIIHDLNGEGFLFYRDCVLAAMPLTALLKHGETLGYYIDSTKPSFSFKMEMSEHGHFRTLMLPADFNDFPKSVEGVARLTKVVKNKKPYGSIIELNNISIEEISNKVIKDSYQMDGHIILSQDSDQAALIMKLPRKSWDKDEILPEGIPLKDFVADFKKKLPTILNEGNNDEEAIKAQMESDDFYFMQGKDISFKCSCSRERMVQGVQSLVGSHTLDEIFLDKPSLEAKCDYCKTFYQIRRDEITPLKH